MLRLAREALRSGSIAAIVMIPFGLAFMVFGQEVNRYGRAVIQTFFGGFPPAARFGLFVLEHFLISWFAAVPLLYAFGIWRSLPPILLGILYGTGFWFFINSLLLPTLFGHSLPWQPAGSFSLPSLVVHLVYGISIAITAKRFVGEGVTFSS